MNTLTENIQNKKSGILLYGFTPPKSHNSREKNLAISQKRLERLAEITIDGLVIYDIQDETSRLNTERPFPFLPTLDPIDYYQNYLTGLQVPPIIYQCVGKYTPVELDNRIRQLEGNCTVFVGAPSHNEQVKTSMKEAYQQFNPAGETLLGGIVISERHAVKSDEHNRIIRKQKEGCRFFISQCVYDGQKFKNMLSDYMYHCNDNGLEMAPVICTVSPCGSKKTVDLLKWLGISIPAWIENDLAHSVDTLDLSMKLCKAIVSEIMEFCITRNIPFGCNVESVSIRKEEVLASFELAGEIEQLFIKAGLR